MEMEVSDLDGDVRKVILSGRLDTQGVDAIENQFTASVVPVQKPTIVDLSDVEFIASMGIRMFISVGRSLSVRHVGIALYAPQDLVAEVFDNISMSDIMPICSSEAEAISAVSA